MQQYQLIDNKEMHRYEYHIEFYRPNIEYKTRDNEIALLHTNIPEDIRGKGIGTQLVKDTLDNISQHGLKVIPICSFVARYIKKHPEYQHLLKEGITIG